MGDINFLLDFGDIICLYLYMYIYFLFSQGGCHVTIGLLAHDYITFLSSRINACSGGVNKLVHNVCPRVYSSSM